MKWSLTIRLKSKFKITKNYSQSCSSIRILLLSLTHTELRVHALSWSHSHGTADPRSNAPKDGTATETILVLADQNLELQIIRNS